MSILGYSNTQKGYKCYHPQSEKVLITKYVTFDENRFYYQSNTELQEEQEDIRREIPTPLPFLSTSEEKEELQPQENQVDTLNSVPQAEP